MCLPISFLKLYNGVGAGLSILFGLFGIIYSMILLFDDAGDLDIQTDSREALCYGIFGASFIVFIFGILAMIGVMKRKNLLIVGYNIVVILATVVFLGLAIGASVVPKAILNNTCNSNNSTNQDWSNQLNTLAMQANTTFCQQGCPCFVNSTIFSHYTNSCNKQSNQLKLRTDQMTMYAKAPYLSTALNTLAWNYSACPQFQNATEQQKNNYNILSNLESNFKCSGWCNVSATYMFITPTQDYNQQPTSACQASLQDFYHSWGRRIEIGSWIIFGVFLLNTMMACCLVCHPQKRSGSIYQRLSG